MALPQALLATIGETFVAMSQPLITVAVLDALERVDGIIPLLTELDAKGADLLAQEIAQAATAARGTLPEWMGEEFEKQFGPRYGAELVNTLKTAAESICRDPEMMKFYVDELIGRAKRRAQHAAP